MNNTLFPIDEIPTVRSDVLRNNADEICEFRTPYGQYTTEFFYEQFNKLRATIKMLITRHQYVSGAIRRLTEENLMLKEKLKQYEQNTNRN